MLARIARRVPLRGSWRPCSSAPCRSLSSKPLGRQGDEYILSSEEISLYRERGYLVLPSVFSEEELASFESTVDWMFAGNSEKPFAPKDFCDMSQPLDTPVENFRLVNVMLPREYTPSLQGNVYERVSASLAAQLFPDVEMVLDYDQLLNKRPHQPEAEFAMHYDRMYWPPESFHPDTRTATFSLALDATTQENGAIQFIPGSHKEKGSRAFRPVGKDREEAHAIQVELFPDDVVEYAEVPRGGLSIHDEYVIHGSAGNQSDGNRRTYVIAFRTREMVEKERSIGFNHSHNSEANWDNFEEYIKSKQQG